MTARAMSSICCSPPGKGPGALPDTAAQNGEVAEGAVEVGADADRVAPGVGAEQEVLLHGHVAEDFAAFGHLGDPGLDDGVGGPAVDALAAEADLAGGGRQQAGDDVERGALAGAVGAQQRDDAALGHAKANAGERLDAAIAGADAVEFEQVRHGRLPDRPR